ncbi:nickel ABC transporter permease [Candidatus Manganitrophus noduliformans]|uniref:ABC transporter permease n=1 Tax=Candidatus Manganitrophus noduliformans TaxID=2606439 RepID=A0A7X6DL65_9BACT|nr:nickel ABC transporter permease [Candidatus Manganitrophus noduliformans]NKE69222.1 ABC transporter permease [Candidatus Manganitrophus noduliformans]
MARFLIRRLLWSGPVLLGVLTLVFFLIHLIPGDPIDVMLGERAAEADRAALREALHLDDPILTQYGRFLAGVARGDLGRSLTSQRPVAGLILARYPATLQLAAAALLLSLSIALPLGILSAVRPRTAVDAGGLLFSLFGVSMPTFWLGPLLIILFSLKLDWLPVSGRHGIASLVLPALTLGLGMSAILVRMTRSSLLEIFPKEFVLAARAKGLPERRVILRHALRNALIPLLTVVGLQIGALLTGSIITETIFSWPGLGRLTIQAIQSRDYPLVQGCILAIALTYLLVNLLIDLLYAAADPRVQYE